MQGDATPSVLRRREMISQWAAHTQRSRALYCDVRAMAETQGVKSSAREVAERPGIWAEARR